MASLPIIDFGKWQGGSAEDKQRIAQELAKACKQVGFVYIINHGVRDDLLDEAFGWSKRLFDLPEEKKMLAPHPPGSICKVNVQRRY
jgi:isopenicillin N synthase-like dioxygenase